VFQGKQALRWRKCAHIRHDTVRQIAHSAPPNFETSEIFPADEISLCGSHSMIKTTATRLFRQDNAICPDVTNTFSHN
jgi:hypothetical protein